MKLTTMARAIAMPGVAMPVLAQTTAPSQRVEITGLSIQRIAAEGALPVQVISRQDMERQGIVTAEQPIMTRSSNGNGLDNLASNADVVDGAARGNNGAFSANLRGQGAASTPVLLNGRRVAAHGLNGGVIDLNSIPFAAAFATSTLYNALSRDNLSHTGLSTGPTLPGGGAQTCNGINVLDLPGQIGCNAIDGVGACEEVLWATPSANYGCAWDTGIRNLGLTVRVKNLFDTAPPFSAVHDSNIGAGSSCEPRVADPRGRSFTLKVDYKFL